MEVTSGPELRLIDVPRQVVKLCGSHPETIARRGAACWAWTPPAGARVPNEDIAVCAAGELREESGLTGSPRPLAVEDVDWAVFQLVVPWGTPVAVDGVEHDRYEWLPLEDACSRCLPRVVGESLKLAICE